MTQAKPQDQPPRPWDRFISDLDREVYSKCGFGAPVGLGQRPALLIIDAQYRTTGESPVPILEAMKQCATAIGEEAWKAVGQVDKLLTRFREAGWSVMYAQGERTGGAVLGIDSSAISTARFTPNAVLVPPWVSDNVPLFSLSMPSTAPPVRVLCPSLKP